MKVVPRFTGVTNPNESTLAIEGLLDVQFKEVKTDCPFCIVSDVNSCGEPPTVKLSVEGNMLIVIVEVDPHP